MNLSKITLGLWRAHRWNYSTKELCNYISQLIDVGVTSFDHADIYGGHTCESIFGEALKENPSLRNSMQIVTKCGIKPLSPKFPETTVKHYDTRKQYIISSAERSLGNLNTDFIDLLLIHRPDPVMNADEIAEAFYQLRKSGKVLHFGVSNFLPHQFSLLQSRLDFPLATNQIEVSVLCTEHFDNGNIDFLQEKRVSPMVWSPLAAGRIFSDDSERAVRVRTVLVEIAAHYGVGIDAIALAWLMVHPVNFIAVLGTGKISRVVSAMRGLQIKLTREEWFKIWIASKGNEVP